MKYKMATRTYIESTSTISILKLHPGKKKKRMAAVTTQASIAGLRPCASKTRFLTGSSGKLNREVSFKPVASASFKVEAKKGQWLPGLASPGYLDGRYLYENIFIFCTWYIFQCIGKM